MKIGLVDLNTGNLTSLQSALNKLNLKFKICKNSFDFEGVDKIILPGVGAFKDFIKKFNTSGIDKIILSKTEKKIPILGICVGFQVLFSDSTEHGFSKGLDILKGNIVSFTEFKKDIRVPHVGWNECKIRKDNNLFYGIEDKSDFYFTHTYHLKKCSENIVISESNYYTKFVSAINYENIYGVQFHPEKSQLNGLKIIKNFYERC